MSAPVVAVRRRDRSVLGMAPRTAVALLVASVAGLAMFAWPLVLDPPADYSHTRDAPYIFALILPVLVAIVLTEMICGFAVALLVLKFFYRPFESSILRIAGVTVRSRRNMSGFLATVFIVPLVLLFMGAW